jgi:farnesyl-diphosphate farnesyltransferase
MRAELETEILKGVSRSFYLSLRLLPLPMRRAAGIAYLLARTGDTIADSVSGSVGERIDALLDFLKQVKGEHAVKSFREQFYDGITDPREARLLQSHVEILEALRGLGAGEIELIHEVLETIVGGQVLDLQRFGNAGNKLHSLRSAEELEDYAWRVAGCVGLFWTRLGFLTLGEKFSNHPQAELEQWGVEYGKGLQLVNILRDFPEDRRMGRCYLPVSDPRDEAACFREFQTWRATALQKVALGQVYADKLLSWRLRLASGLPALIAEETLKRLDVKGLTDLEPRVKVPRWKLYQLLFQYMLT